MPTQWTPSARELDDLELILTGVFDDGVLRADSTVDGGPSLAVPADVASAAEDGLVELTDPEGLPLARLDLRTRHLTPLTHPQFGAFRRYHRTPQQVREQHRADHGGTATFAVPVIAPLTQDAIDTVNAVARSEQATPILLALVGAGTPQGVSAPALVRATLAAATQIEHADVVAVAAARRDDAGSTADSAADREFRDTVALAFADEVLHLGPATGPLPADVAAIVDQDRPARDRRGLVVFFTGLSGSGKSTLARALHDRLLERGDRTVTSLDGDVVRRHLSAGLGFSKEDRETNIRRIGWVAAEISRHGGVAICSPIAPFDSTRQQVRSMVDATGGGFVLVHVATPLQECERRDRKGLYARARAGEIPEFTGISSPYEEPADATVTVDTTGRSVADALDDVVATLRTEGWLA
ncbi:MAG TPA: adenylyl-sulfate kinase [Nocardioidaceae bacterium]|nr:adenylyl-sulfate kinase [Nocardioidaceae bacterium]